MLTLRDISIHTFVGMTDKGVMDKNTILKFNIINNNFLMRIN